VNGGRPAADHRYAVVEAGADALGDLTRMRLAWSAEHGLAATGDAALDAFRDRMQRWWDQQSGHRRAWAVRDAAGTAVGMANLSVFTRMPRPGVPDVHWAYVANVWVDPAHRCRGVGRLLMQGVVDWAREAGMIRIVLNPSEVSLPLYRGLGFTPAGDLLRLDL
jgi:GNAT superfamily N-acetyltransferase